MLQNGHLGMLRKGHLGMLQIGCLEHVTEWVLFVGNATYSELSAASYKGGIACAVCYKWTLPVAYVTNGYCIWHVTNRYCLCDYKMGIIYWCCKWALAVTYITNGH